MLLHLKSIFDFIMIIYKIKYVYKGVSFPLSPSIFGVSNYLPMDLK